jgi:hypothetical protein
MAKGTFDMANADTVGGRGTDTQEDSEQTYGSLTRNEQLDDLQTQLARLLVLLNDREINLASWNILFESRLTKLGQWIGENNERTEQAGDGDQDTPSIL